MALVDLITSTDPLFRHLPLERAAAGKTLEPLLTEAAALDDFRRTTPNLYERVRACFFLYALHRFHLPPLLTENPQAIGLIPPAAHHHLLERRFGEAVEVLLDRVRQQGPSDALCSALAQGYHRLALQSLADQVRASVRQVRGNQWMFRCGVCAQS
jgi:hypothetical protein